MCPFFKGIPHLPQVAFTDIPHFLHAYVSIILFVFRYIFIDDFNFLMIIYSSSIQCSSPTDFKR
jgi:hypothetical protein